MAFNSSFPSHRVSSTLSFGASSKTVQGGGLADKLKTLTPIKTVFAAKGTRELIDHRTTDGRRHAYLAKADGSRSDTYVGRSQRKPDTNHKHIDDGTVTPRGGESAPYISQKQIDTIYKDGKPSHYAWGE